MSHHNPFEHFDFSPRRRIPPLLIAEVIGLGGLLFAWWLVPHGLLVILLLPAVAALIWAASFGWRQALSRLIDFLQSIQNVPFGGF
jgi:hypothetical protein